MPGYIQVALQLFHHMPPDQPEHAPYKYLNPTHSLEPAEPIPEDTPAPVKPPQITRLQQIIETL